MDTIERVRAVAEPLLQAEGTELVDVELHAGALRLTVDRPGGVDLAVITRATRHVTAALDHEGSLTADYTLEVSSPGLERPLRTPAQFVRAVGSSVAVKTVPGTAGDRRIQGRLESADDTAITVVETGGAVHRVAYDRIERARTVFEWGPGSKPGHKPQPGRSSKSSAKSSSSSAANEARQSAKGRGGGTVAEQEVGDR